MRNCILCGILLFGTLPLNAVLISIDHHNVDRRLAPEKIQSYMRTISGLRQAGSNHIYEAEQLSTIVPDHAARYAIGISIGSLITALSSGNAANVAFTATFCVVGRYIEGCYDRYWEIQDHLKNAQRCFEVAESLSAELARKEQDPRLLQ